MELIIQISYVFICYSYGCAKLYAWTYNFAHFARIEILNRKISISIFCDSGIDSSRRDDDFKYAHAYLGITPRTARERQSWKSRYSVQSCSVWRYMFAIILLEILSETILVSWDFSLKGVFREKNRKNWDSKDPPNPILRITGVRGDGLA